MTLRFQRFASFTLTLLLAVPLSALTETRTRPRTSALDATSIVAAMNRERVAHGLRPLRLDAKLSLAAGDRARDMLAKHYFAHESPDGIDPFDWVDRRGYRYRAIGENLAVGYRSAQAVVGGWMRSEGHRHNILLPDFDEVGIAIADDSPQRPYSAPLVVALYGRR